MKVTLTTLTSRYGSIDALNANFEALADAIENTLSLDGTSPNALESNLDLNSHRIINLPSPTDNSDAATKEYVDTVTALLNNYVDEIQIVADNIADIVIAADIDPTDLATVADSATDIATVAGISSNITTVAGIAANVTAVAAVDTEVTTVAGIAADVSTVSGISAAVSTVATNITDIQNAEENADAAAASALAAQTAETNAETAQSAAEAAKSAAEAARDATLAAYDNFDDRYLGSKTSDPATDNDGNALVGGMLYYNSTAGAMKVYNGSAWVSAYVSGDGYMPLTGGTMSGDITFSSTQAGTFTQVNVKAQGDVRFEDTTGGQYVALQAPGTVGTSFTLTLPATDGSSGQAIVTDGSGNLSFGNAGISTGKSIAMAMIFGF